MNLQQLDWQTIVALTIVSTAIAVLARKSWNMVFQPVSSGCGSGCGSCPSAPSNGSNNVTELLQLNSNSRDRD